ncbi:MAG: DUF6404 family protein [Pseudomonadota bacterium]
MEFKQRRAAALALLAQTGIMRSNYEPPLLRMLWRAGVEVPPPHFATSWKVGLIAGAYFCVAMGTLMWIVGLFGQQRALEALAGSALVAGLFFGLAMAAYYAYGKRKYGLPDWEQLTRQAPTP